MKAVKHKTVFFLILIATLYLPSSLLADNPIQDMLRSSVMILKEAEELAGSGVVITRNIVNQNNIVEKLDFVITCAHVVKDYKIYRVVDTEHNIVEVVYQVYSVAQEKYNQLGEAVGFERREADVIYLNLEEDIAVLKLRRRITTQGHKNLKFYSGAIPPQIGSQIYHIGSWLSFGGSFSLSEGIVSKIGRKTKASMFPDSYIKSYDQTTCTIFSGSSGGGVFLPSGEYVGMASLSIKETFSLYAPIRRIKTVLDAADFKWVLDTTKKAPTLDALNKIVLR